MKHELNEMTVCKIRDGRICLPMKTSEGDIVLYDKRYIDEGTYSGGIIFISDYSDDLTFGRIEFLDVMTYKTYTSQIEALRVILSGDEPYDWDWEREEIEEDWAPKDGETYYAISSTGCVVSLTNSNTMSDECIEIGNCFKTEYDAKVELGRRNLLYKIKKFAKECNRRNKADGNWRYNIYYSLKLEKLEVNALKHIRYLNTIHFNNEEDAKKCIELFGDDVIKYGLVDVE